MKLHLGCGQIKIEGWVNIDLDICSVADDIADVGRLEKYNENSVDAIYACHVLEHFGRHEYLSVLQRWFSLLRSGGKLYIAVPDFEACIERYSETKDFSELVGLIYGGQVDEYDFHSIGFDFPFLCRSLKSVGFDSVERFDWRIGPNPDLDDYSKAYLPHMDQGGRLMSLNVVAFKSL